MSDPGETYDRRRGPEWRHPQDTPDQTRKGEISPGQASDSIHLSGIEVFAFHGVLPEETAQGQTFLIDVEVGLDLSRAGASDDLADTVDYGSLVQRVHDLVATDRWNLIERVAARVAESILEDPRADSVVITVHKPAAPIGVGFSDVAVTVRRERDRANWSEQP
jgi:dihydroneopterin aldolase